MASPQTLRASSGADPPDRPFRQETVVVLASDDGRRAQLVELITSAGWLPLVAESAADVVQMLADAPPDLFILAVDDEHDDDLSVIDRIRSGPDGELVPVVCLLDHQHRRLTLEAFGRRADDVVSGHPDPSELIARLQTRIERPPVPRSELVVDPVTGALTSEAFAQQLHKEEEQVRRGGEPGAIAFISFDELPEMTARHGSRGRDELLAQLVRLIKADGRKLDFVGWRRNMIAILLPATPMKGAQARFDRLIKKIYDREFMLDGTPVRLTPVIGYTATIEQTTVEQYEDRAWDALVYQADQLDLHPTKWVAAMSKSATSPTRLGRLFDKYRTPFQVVTQQLAAIILPFLTYWMLDSIGVDITGVVYLGLVMALGVTATLIWGESHTAIEPTVPPEAPDRPPPRASAIIAAYLPNEAGTVLETVEAFLEQDYPDLEVILAYNTPTPLDVEDDLRAIAGRDPRFVPFRVDGSVSKAQNVNAALARVTGEFVGLFDADHHPAPGSFHRAWRWIAGGAGVVQGHCVIRNGDTNLVTRLVATEFEAIYAVSHPGRARLHGFGVFGGSNGYWRTTLLHRTRMRGSMLTEDIDSSMRVVQSGEVIISDPELVSTELAPDTAAALWNQRLRWAQGWSQVSLRHLVEMTRKLPRLRQRVGAAYLLGWREIYPWISLQMFPLLGYWWFQGQPAIEWFVPIFVFTSLLTFSAGPAQTWYAWRLAHPSIKRHKRWFVGFLFASLLFYTEVKNVVARTAHLKELMRERKWKVTPRTGSVALDAEAAAEESTLTPDEPSQDTRGVEHPEPETAAAHRSGADRSETVVARPIADDPAASQPGHEPGTPVVDADGIRRPGSGSGSGSEAPTIIGSPVHGSETTTPAAQPHVKGQSEPRPPFVPSATNPQSSAAPPAPPESVTATRDSGIRRRRCSSQTPLRRERHNGGHQQQSAPSRRPTIYDHSMEAPEPTIYDYEREDVAVLGGRLEVSETDASDRSSSPQMPAPNGERNPHNHRATGAPAPWIGTPRHYEPDFLQQLLHRDRHTDDAEPSRPTRDDTSADTNTDDHRPHQAPRPTTTTRR